MIYDPSSNFIGGFSPNDGTVDFYLRVKSLVKSTDTVLDLGAGRAAWFEDDTCDVRRDLILLKGKVNRVIAADIDEAVLGNRASDEQIVIKDGQLGLEKNSVDVIVADFVLEHITDVDEFVQQVGYVLKDGGWFCARTPHKFNYVALFASIIKNSKHSKVLAKVQPDRKELDVFPTAYKLNTMKGIRTSFVGWRNNSFVFRANPSYFFGRKIVYDIQNLMHRLMFKEFCGHLFVFCQKV